MFCGQCGKSVDADAKFCPHCGATVAAAASTPPPAFTPPPPITPAASTAASAASSAGAQASAAAAEAAAALRAVDPAGLFARVKGIMLSPRSEWPVIAAENRTAMQVYAGYAAPLVALSVICGLIGMVAFGITVPLVGTVRMPIASALWQAIVGFVMTFVGLFVLSLIINALAPQFGGQKDSVRALKVAAYSYTPAWIGGMLAIIPLLGLIGSLIGLYGLYLLYLGLPVLMRVAQDKALTYTIVIVLCAIVIGFIIAAVVGSLSALVASPLAGLSTSTSVASHAGNDAAAGILASAMGGKTDADKARMKDAMAQLQKMGEQADKAEKVARANGGDASAAAASQVDMGAAMAAVSTMMAGGKDVKPVDFHSLQDLLPTSVGGLARREASSQSSEAMGVKGSSASARYANDSGSEVTLQIADLGSLSGLAGLASKFDPNIVKETDSTYERTQRVDGQLVHQRYDRAAKSGAYDAIIGNRFAVTVTGNNVTPETLAAAVKAVDTSKLVALAK